jgi:hypothetical protein
MDAGGYALMGSESIRNQHTLILKDDSLIITCLVANQFEYTYSVNTRVAHISHLPTRPGKSSSANRF